MSSSARVFIEPNNLRQVWDYVREGLLKVKEASSEPWIPEDIYCDCYSGRSMLWLMVENDQPVGFGVLQPVGDSLHIWAGYGKFLMDEGFRHAEEIAKSGGARRITFESNRPGWARMADKHGYKPVRWAKEVSYG